MCHNLTKTCEYNHKNDAWVTDNLIKLDTLATVIFVETKSFSKLLLLPDFFGFFRGIGPSQSHLLWTVQTSLPWSQPSLVLLPKQDKMEEFFLQHLQTPSARSDSPPPPGLPHIRASPACHFWHYFFHFWPLWALWPFSSVTIFAQIFLIPRPWGLAKLLDFFEDHPCPHPSERVG